MRIIGTLAKLYFGFCIVRARIVGRPAAMRRTNHSRTNDCPVSVRVCVLDACSYTQSVATNPPTGVPNKLKNIVTKILFLHRKFDDVVCVYAMRPRRSCRFCLLCVVQHTNTASTQTALRLNHQDKKIDGKKINNVVRRTN